MNFHVGQTKNNTRPKQLVKSRRLAFFLITTKTVFIIVHNVFSGSPSNLDVQNFGAHAVSAWYKMILQKFGGYLYHADTAWAPKFCTFRSEGDTNMLRQCTLCCVLKIQKSLCFDGARELSFGDLCSNFWEFLKINFLLFTVAPIKNLPPPTLYWPYTGTFQSNSTQIKWSWKVGKPSQVSS